MVIMYIMKIKIKETAKLKKNFSLYRLAKEMNLSEQTVYSWAKGRTQPNYENLDRICDILNCSIADILEAEPVQKKLF